VLTHAFEELPRAADNRRRQSTAQQERISA